MAHRHGEDRLTGLRLTGMEKSWIMYDVGNSAFVLMLATVIPIYFNFIAEGELSSVDYLAYWGYAASMATLACALLGPVLGTYSDRKGTKVWLFVGVVAVGVCSCALLGFVNTWVVFLALIVVARLAYSLSLIFYDSMLVDITTFEKADRVSAMGYAWGYLGSCIPFVVCLALILGCDMFGITMQQGMTLSMIIVAVWWVGSTIPLVRKYRQKHFISKEESKGALLTLARTIRSAKTSNKAFVFLIAFFFFIDGVYTIIEMATAYGQAIGLDSTMLLVALLVTQVVAFPSTIIIGRLSGRVDPSKLIVVCIVAYMLITMFAVGLDNITEFFILATLVGMFQGGIQALSRSYFAKIIPPQRSGEFFGLMDVFGKGASFMGTMVVSLVSQMTGDMSLGILSIMVLFIVGLVVFVKSAKMPADVQSDS